MKKDKISIIGLGKLGFPLALAYTHRNFDVIGVDKNKELVEDINNGILPLSSECELDAKEFFIKYKNKIEATTSMQKAIKETSVSFIIVNTPSLSNGDLSLKSIFSVCEEIGEFLKNKTDFHVFSICSTVTPGSMEIIKNKLEQYSGKKCGIDFGLCCTPEFNVALGTIIENYLMPQFAVIGEFDKKSGDMIYFIFNKFYSEYTSIIRTNFINTELAKFALNSYLTIKISFANELTEICEKLKDADVDIITSIIGKDYRVGNSFLKGGLSFGGPCFIKDPKAFYKFAKEKDSDLLLIETATEVNINQRDRIINLINKNINILNNDNLGVLGIAYKPGINSTEESPALDIIEHVAMSGINVHIYDSKIDFFRDNINFTFDKPTEYLTIENSVEECIKNSKVILIANPYKEFEKINSGILRDKIIIDCWRILNDEQIKSCKKYIPIGKNK